ncbi:MFS transporter [Saccharomonospora xinjiangensis]|uniref:Arabinose efflux permease family protein n=1 Tax=Saccharomonospora xinjiangensis XJ-54 TaxID=882086 RepID=I0UWS1_9PSEU|nr:MFS transporter [Saccharomonospora xinjiangensis]EID52324.1 arabinose efflux permease family protein [Saccharomonospora xinjiangensis XJ-54]
MIVRNDSPRASLFGNRDYWHLFGAQVVALFGTGLTTVALGLLAYELAGERAGAVLGTALALKMVVYVTIAPVAGAFADRVPRRALLVTLDSVRAASVLALPFVTEIWQVYVLIVVLQSASAAFTPTFQAVLPDILPDERDYTRALSASQLASSMETLLSPMLAAALLSVLSFHWLFTGTTAGFLVSALLVVTARVPRARRSARTGLADRLSAGARIFLTTPRLRGVLALNLAVAGAGAMVMVNTVNYTRDALGRGDADVALLLGAHGAGTILVALALPPVLDRFPERRIMLTGSAALCTGVVAAVALSSAHSGDWRWPAVVLVWAVVGTGTGLVLTPIGRVLRRSADDADRPAVFAAQFSLSHACWLLSYPIAGWLVTASGFTRGWLALSLLTVVGTVAATRLWPRTDQPG